MSTQNWDSLTEAVEALREDFPRTVTAKSLMQCCQELEERVTRHLSLLETMTHAT